jgi:hypothetical protein
MNLAFSNALSNKIGGVVFLAVLAISTNTVAQQQGQSKISSPSRYTLRDLGTLPGGAFSQAAGVTGYGLVSGVSTVSDGTRPSGLRDTNSTSARRGWEERTPLDLASISGPKSQVRARPAPQIRTTKTSALMALG